MGVGITSIFGGMSLAGLLRLCSHIAATIGNIFLEPMAAPESESTDYEGGLIMEMSGTGAL